MESILNRIEQVADNEGIKITPFETVIGASKGVFSRAIKRNTDISSKWVTKIVEKYPQYNSEWLLTGRGNMLKSDTSYNKKLIPLYDEVVTIGGTQNQASTHAVLKGSNHEMIDAGDWFPNATAAIRHYEDSMVEYPSGSILVLREIEDRELIFWGKNYVVETEDGRLTKRLQRGEKGYVVGYSSNTERYEDGRLIHEPIELPMRSVRRLFLVLGCISKQFSSGVLEIIN